jgi:hypothetical protein
MHDEDAIAILEDALKAAEKDYASAKGPRVRAAISSRIEHICGAIDWFRSGDDGQELSTGVLVQINWATKGAWRFN